jgi:hypothetical protein
VQKNASRLGEYFVDYLRLLRRSLMKSRLALPCLASGLLLDATEIGGCLLVAAASLTLQYPYRSRKAIKMAIPAIKRAINLRLL